MIKEQKQYESLSFIVDDLIIFEDKQKIDLMTNPSNYLNLMTNWFLLSRKENQPVRNRDYRSDQMKNYEVLKSNYYKQQKKIKKVNDKTDSLNEKSKNIKEIISNLKHQPLNKNNVLLSNDNKDKIIKYIEDIESNNNHKGINKLEDKNEELQEELDAKRFFIRKC